jgi:hypothetical protein
LISFIIPLALYSRASLLDAHAQAWSP